MMMMKMAMCFVRVSVDGLVNQLHGLGCQIFCCYIAGRDGDLFTLRSMWWWW